MKGHGFRCCAVLILLAVGMGCRTGALRRNLRPEHADFLSKVRYIITRSEEKVFLSLPESKREDFIEEFWKRRNPDPYSEQNEFKNEYYSRLETADRLFRNEGKPGWLTDRGRIYILFGPPLDRIIDPISRNSEERCGEIWYYGGFPVVFRDWNCSGTFQLVTYDLTSIRQYNLIYMQQLNSAQDAAQHTAYRKREPFDFRARLDVASSGPERFEGVIRLSIPYAGIWFREPEVGSLVTALEVEIELRDGAGLTRWRYDGAFDVTAREEILEQEKDSSFIREIPFALAATAGGPSEGKSELRIRLKNRTGGEERSRTLEVRLGRSRARR
jgi:GWxTD domain-containing protein